MRRGARTPIAIITFVAIILIGAVILVGPVGGGNGDPSSVANGKAGTLALYTWLGSLGFDVHRIQGDFDLSDTDVLISAAPLAAAPYSRADSARLLDHVRGGGDVILALADPGAVTAVLGQLGVSAASVTNLAVARPSQPFDPSGAVTSVPLRPPDIAGAPPTSFTLSSGHGELVPLLGDGRAPVAGALRQGGGGRVYVLGTEYPLSNDGLRRGDSALFVLGLIERARGGHIGFDEVHHGLGGSGNDQGIGEVFRGPLLAATLLTVLVALVHLVTSGRRLGRPLPAGDPGRVPGAADYIASIGHLMARSKQRGAVAERYATELKQRLGAVTGAEPRLPDDAFVAAISGFSEERAQRTGALLAEARALAAAGPAEAQLLTLARRVDELEAEWGAGPRGLSHNGAR